MISLVELEDLYSKRENEILEEYKTFLRFQSISADPTHNKETRACADWLEEYLNRIGMHVEVWETFGHPTIFAETKPQDPNKSTLLLYQHYDVQPPDPLELWESPPFEPTIRNGNMYARGAQDNKGQCMSTLFALKVLHELKEPIPINIKLIIEGEEEVGSEGLSKILDEKNETLQSDWLAIVDTGMKDAKTPAVTVGARGIVTFDVNFFGTTTDLHSGTHGGLAYNPLHALVGILASLRDPNTGTISIPGFYDAVQPISDSDREMLSFDFDEQDYVKEFGTKPTGGELSHSPLERSKSRPTLEINGIWGGYSGPGFKTIIPKEAHAKISCRLVPDQDPESIGQLIKEHLEKLAPPGIRIEVVVHSGMGAPLRVNPHSIIAQAFAKSYEEVFQTPAVFMLEGGSIPITGELAKASGAEAIFVGLWLPSDLIHAPNEHFGLDRMKKGFLSLVRMICQIPEILAK